MAATITGVVYNDLNHNGQYDAGEPGLANVAVRFIQRFCRLHRGTDGRGRQLFADGQRRRRIYGL